MGSVIIPGEWLHFEPHGPFFTAAVPHRGTSVSVGAREGVPRVVGWVPVYGYMMSQGQYKEGPGPVQDQSNTG